jgi:hypothetical protein
MKKLFNWEEKEIFFLEKRDNFIFQIFLEYFFFKKKYVI